MNSNRHEIDRAGGVGGVSNYRIGRRGRGEGMALQPTVRVSGG